MMKSASILESNLCTLQGLPLVSPEEEAKINIEAKFKSDLIKRLESDSKEVAELKEVLLAVYSKVFFKIFNQLN